MTTFTSWAECGGYPSGLSVPRHNCAMAARKRRPPGPTDPVEAYRHIRKPMPPPERVLPDKRRAAREREAMREAEQDADREP